VTSMPVIAQAKMCYRIGVFHLPLLGVSGLNPKEFTVISGCYWLAPTTIFFG
jgi:hypothetical protein